MPAPEFRRLAPERGFTLTELIMVIVILAIVSTVSVRFIGFAAQGAIETSERQQMGAAGGLISEILSREIREALPNSIRSREDGRCVEFIPVLAGGAYTASQLTSPHSEFTSEGRAPGPVSGRVAVYPYSASPYAPDNPGSVSLSTATWNDDRVLYDDGGEQRYLGNSPASRFYLIRGPVAFCQSVSGGFLERYDGYELGENFTQGNREVVAAGLVADPGTPVFRVEEASLTRNALVVFELGLTAPRSGETTQLSQEVQIRNVP